MRELNVYCEIHPYDNIPEIENDIKGVILSGSPYSVHDPEAPNPDLSNYRGKFPLLGVCYGAQFLVKSNGGSVVPSDIREYGRANLSFVNNGHELMKEVSNLSQVWMSHGDTIKNIPESFEIIASTEDVE